MTMIAAIDNCNGIRAIIAAIIDDTPKMSYHTGAVAFVRSRLILKNFNTTK